MHRSFTLLATLIITASLFVPASASAQTDWNARAKAAMQEMGYWGRDPNHKEINPRRDITAGETAYVAKKAKDMAVSEANAYTDVQEKTTRTEVDTLKNEMTVVKQRLGITPGSTTSTTIPNPGANAPGTTYVVPAPAVVQTPPGTVQLPATQAAVSPPVRTGSQPDMFWPAVIIGGILLILAIWALAHSLSLGKTVKGINTTLTALNGQVTAANATATVAQATAQQALALAEDNTHGNIALHGALQTLASQVSTLQTRIDDGTKGLDVIYGAVTSANGRVTAVEQQLDQTRPGSFAERMARELADHRIDIDAAVDLGVTDLAPRVNTIEHQLKVIDLTPRVNAIEQRLTTAGIA